MIFTYDANNPLHRCSECGTLARSLSMIWEGMKAAKKRPEDVYPNHTADKIIRVSAECMNWHHFMIEVDL